MSQFSRVAAGVAALILTSVSCAAHAENQVIKVGDLANPAEMAKFNRGLAEATANLCGTHRDNMHNLGGYADCVSAVRTEALGLLSADQRQQYAAVSAHGQSAMQVASVTP